MEDINRFYLIYWVLVPGVAGFMVILLIFIEYMYLHHRKIKALVEALGGKMRLGFFSYYGVIETPEGEFRVWRDYHVMNRYMPTYLLIGHSVTSKFRLTIWQRPWFVTENLPPLPPLEEWFFRKVSIPDNFLPEPSVANTNNRKLAESFLSDQVNCDVIQYFFSRGFSVVRIRPKIIFAVKPQYSEIDLDTFLVRRHLSELARIKIN